MAYEWEINSRKRTLGKVVYYLRNLEVQDLDGFATRLIAEVSQYIEKHGEFPDQSGMEDLMRNIPTALFRGNHHVKKKDIARWLADMLTTVDTTAIRQASTSAIDGPVAKAIRISVDDIDSFRQVQTVSPHEVAHLVPVTLSEADIKQGIAQILGEPFVPKDWGGEIADLFSAQFMFQGKRAAGGFLLKGPGVKGTLTIGRLGKNGDQVVRLTSTSLELYVVQFVGPIAQAVVDHVEAHVRQAAQRACQPRYYCIIDGTDTARLLKAYGQL